MKQNNTARNKQFYVYMLCRPSGEVFYIGKGSGDRVFQHLAEARRCKCKCRKCEIIQEVWYQGKEVEIRIVFESDFARPVLARERELIEEHSELGLLCNKHGVPSERRKQKQRLHNLRIVRDAEFRLRFAKQEWKTARQQHWHDDAKKLAEEITKLEEIIQGWRNIL